MISASKPRARIGINAVCFGRDIASGIQRYIWEICQEFDRDWPDAEFLLYMRDNPGIVLPSQRWTVRMSR